MSVLEAMQNYLIHILVFISLLRVRQGLLSVQIAAGLFHFDGLSGSWIVTHRIFLSHACCSCRLWNILEQCGFLTFDIQNIQSAGQSRSATPPHGLAIHVERMSVDRSPYNALHHRFEARETK